MFQRITGNHRVFGATQADVPRINCLVAMLFEENLRRAR
jgi:hypothetical protein